MTKSVKPKASAHQVIGGNSKQVTEKTRAKIQETVIAKAAIEQQKARVKAEEEALAR